MLAVVVLSLRPGTPSFIPFGLLQESHPARAEPRCVLLRVNGGICHVRLTMGANSGGIWRMDGLAAHNLRLHISHNACWNAGACVVGLQVATRITVVRFSPFLVNGIVHGPMHGVSRGSAQILCSAVARHLLRWA